jgi:hypothetical protein
MDALFALSDHRFRVILGCYARVFRPLIRYSRQQPHSKKAERYLFRVEIRTKNFFLKSAQEDITKIL